MMKGPIETAATRSVRTERADPPAALETPGRRQPSPIGVDPRAQAEVFADAVSQPPAASGEGDDGDLAFFDARQPGVAFEPSSEQVRFDASAPASAIAPSNRETTPTALEDGEPGRYARTGALSAQPREAQPPITFGGLTAALNRIPGAGLFTGGCDDSNDVALLGVGAQRRHRDREDE